MESLRVCHVIHDTHCGGTELTLLKVIRQLRDQHEFSVISLLSCGHVGEELEKLGVPVHSLHLRKNGRPQPHRLLSAVRWFRTWKPDVVQTWAYHSDLVGGLLAKLFTRAPVIWNVRHATLDPKIDSTNTMRSARWCGRLSNWVPNRIILNAYASMPTHQAVGYSAEKMLIIPNGFDTNQFYPQPAARIEIRNELGIPQNAPLIGVAGRFHPHKGQRQFIDMATRLIQRHPELRLVIAGPDCHAENPKLVSWIAQAGLTEAAHLLGERTDIHKVLNALDVYVMPSLTEGLPNVVGEAMACGIPVVATDVGDVARLLGTDQPLVPNQDIAAMVKAVDAYLVMPQEQRRAVGERNVERIEKNYSLIRCAETYDQVWRQALAKKPPSNSSSLEPITPNDDKPSVPRAPAQATSSLLLSPSKTSHPAALAPKIVHVTTVPMTQFFFLRGQLEFMKNRGFDLHCVSSPGDFLERLAARDPVTTHAIPIARKISCLADGIALFRLWKTLRNLRPEIVQLSTPKAALLGAVAAKLAGVPVRIYQVRGLSSESEKGWRRKFFQTLERLTARLCTDYLVNAQSLLDYAVQSNILKAGFVAGQGMSNGVDTERFHPDKTLRADLSRWDSTWENTAGPIIGFVGRLTHDKGLAELHFAWRHLRERYPNTRLLLVGPWEKESEVDAQVKAEFQADPRVLAVGLQDNVAQFYQCMDVFVYPSHGTEGFPNAPMEAAAMQLPVITTQVVGCVDAVQDNVTGVLIPPRDGKALADTLRRYIEEPLLRLEHGQAGRKRVVDFYEPESLWQQFYDFYCQILSAKRLKRPATITTDQRNAA